MTSTSTTRSQRARRRQRRGAPPAIGALLGALVVSCGADADVVVRVARPGGALTLWVCGAEATSRCDAYMLYDTGAGPEQIEVGIFVDGTAALDLQFQQANPAVCSRVRVPGAGVISVVPATTEVALTVTGCAACTVTVGDCDYPARSR